MYHNYIIFLFHAFLYFATSSYTPINIALHAQVSPNEKIVGSVITTDGLRSAFLLRHPYYVNVVETFYPFHYLGFFDNIWDLILIEGWFPSINHFIYLARSNNPSAIIMFYCLDPSYPGINVISTLDVDGMLTNSAEVKLRLNAILPTKYVMLAVNQHVMKPIEEENHRNGGIVYIGAGGGMVKYKTRLLDMLHAAVPFGLSLYGSHWDEIESLKHVWKGVLPRFELANVYSKADIVLASTMDDQGKSGMINNRIFEALSCGAVIISDDWPVLREEFGDILFYTNDTINVATQIQYIFRHSEEIGRKRQQARSLILQKHTWSHRVVDILSFYQELKQQQRRRSEGILIRPLDTYHASNTPERNVTTTTRRRRSICLPSRSNTPTLAWVISERIRIHSDYLMVKDTLLSHLCTQYEVNVIPEELWWNSYHNLSWIYSFDAVFLVTVPFDRLDVSILDIPMMPTVTTTTTISEENSFTTNNLTNNLTTLAYLPYHRKQRRGAYWIGYSYPLIQEAVIKYGSKILTIDRYDTLWYRDSYDLELLGKCNVIFISYRLQHVFGISTSSSSSSSSSSSQDGSDATSSSSHSWSTGSTTTNPKKSSSNSISTEGTVAPTTSSDSTSTPSHNTMKHQLPLFLCFFSSAPLCTHDIRRSITSNQNATVVLLGGSWERWLQIEGIVDIQTLPFTVHSPMGTISDSLVQIVQEASLLYIMTPGDTYLELPTTDTRFTTTTTTARPTVISSTVEDEIWPLVTAAMSNTRVHLLLLHSHILYYSNIDSKSWTADYVKRSVGHGVARLNGFASSQSAVRIDPISSETVTGNDSFKLPVILSDFVLGVDGQCCILVSPPTTTLACYYRQDISIYIKLRTRSTCEVSLAAYSPRYHFDFCPRYRNVVLRVELRGPMFSNPISSASVTIDKNNILTLWGGHPVVSKKSIENESITQKMTLTVDVDFL